jgi:catechol 2,3-dioxygenase-like lactoylglutathione lyase family enzyme
MRKRIKTLDSKATLHALATRAAKLINPQPNWSTTMLDYATIGTNDFDKSAQFFDTVFGALGYQRAHDYSEQKMVAYGASPQADGLVWLCQPHNKQTATPANGAMLGLTAKTRAQVDAFHAAALAHGGSCEGAPGLRDAYGPNMYMAYIRDPLGNKFSALCKAG